MDWAGFPLKPIESHGCNFSKLLKSLFNEKIHFQKYFMLKYCHFFLLKNVRSFCTAAKAFHIFSAKIQALLNLCVLELEDLTNESLNTVKTLNIGTPRLTTIVVLNIKQFNFTMQ